MKEHPLSNNIFIWEVKIAGDLGEHFILMVNVDQSRSELEISDGGNTQASDSSEETCHENDIVSIVWENSMNSVVLQGTDWLFCRNGCCE